MYKYELHCHTRETSICGSIPAKKIVDEYIKAGYSGIVVTDHFSSHNFRLWRFTKWDKIVDKFLAGYKEMKKYETENFKIFLGMEARFIENSNDYLVYGFDEEFLYKSKDIFSWGIEKFSKVSHENKFFLAQAHPYRRGMKIIDSKLLDGVEVNNGNKRHNSKNDLAEKLANDFNLIKLSGSDYHEYEDLAQGGIEINKQLNSVNDLINILYSGKYNVIRCEKK